MRGFGVAEVLFRAKEAGHGRSAGSVNQTLAHSVRVLVLTYDQHLIGAFPTSHYFTRVEHDGDHLPTFQITLPADLDKEARIT